MSGAGFSLRIWTDLNIGFLQITNGAKKKNKKQTF